MKVAINICTRDRVTELSILLQSLRTQTFKDFDIYILDDASGTMLTVSHFFNCLVNRLKYEDHRVEIHRNGHSRGIAKARQQLVETTLESGEYNAICRLDDDVVLEPDYLERLVEVLGKGYDIASGVTPGMGNMEQSRETRFVRPVINRIVLDEKGVIVFNGDDCGYTFTEAEVVPAHHFRSNAMIKTEVHRKIKYEDNLAKHSFREETFFSLRALKAGFKIGVDTGAVVYHFCTPSGGERSHASVVEDQLHNERMLNTWVKKNLDPKEFKMDKSVDVRKDTNLILTEETL